MTPTKRRFRPKTPVRRQPPSAKKKSRPVRSAAPTPGLTAVQGVDGIVLVRLSSIDIISNPILRDKDLKQGTPGRPGKPKPGNEVLIRWVTFASGQKTLVLDNERNRKALSIPDLLDDDRINPHGEVEPTLPLVSRHKPGLIAGAVAVEVSGGYGDDEEEG